MNTMPRVEGRTDEPSPLDAWFSRVREDLEDKAVGLEIERAEAIDQGDKAAVIRLFNARAVLEAREEHLLELSFMCDPAISRESIVGRLGDHVDKLVAILTSQNELAEKLGDEMTATGHIRLGGEEAKIRARIADTTSLLHEVFS